jgi:hypothetical protein
LRFVSGWQMALVVLATVPFLAICLGMIANVVQSLIKKNQETYEEAGGVASGGVLFGAVPACTKYYTHTPNTGVPHHTPHHAAPHPHHIQKLVPHTKHHMPSNEHQTQQHSTHQIPLDHASRNLTARTNHIRSIACHKPQHFTKDESIFQFLSHDRVFRSTMTYCRGFLNGN